jgi:dTDP-glucose 4,6-dehydratase
MILVTGGAGFIGGNFLKYIDDEVVCLDNLTYASNYEFIKPLVDSNKVKFYEGDIADERIVSFLLGKYKPKYIVNFAAESHVDNSIDDCSPFVHTNIIGTINLLKCANRSKTIEKFLHVSTDEVYGSLELDSTNSFKETTPYSPKNPYSASKASSDHFVQSFHNTYGIPTVITNCSNNYGPNQNSEKLIPKIIKQATNNQKIPIYGDGQNVRDWLYVEDHCRGIELALKNGIIGEKYNIGGGIEVSNLELTKRILAKLNKPESLIEFVTDRPGHDRRYSIDCSKITNELGYTPHYNLEDGLEHTINWYLSNPSVFDRPSKNST